MAFDRRRMAFRAALCGVLSWCGRAVAQAPAPAPGPAPQCFPQCRAGYLCNQGQCVSMCNPPCPANQVCVDGLRCEMPASRPPVYEPPPPPLPPSSFAERNHTALGFHLGFAGSVERNGVQQDLVTTLGFNLRADVPVVRYLVLGPLFQLGAWRPDSSPAPSRNFYVDVDLFVRGRVPVQLDNIGLEFWAGVPVGLSLSFLGEEENRTLEAFGLGWNIGVLFGGAVHFTPSFGMFTELGWMQHRMTHDFDKGRGDVDFRLGQGIFNIGFVFAN